VLRGLLAGAFWGLLTGGLVLVVAAAVIENRREAIREPPAAAVETAPPGLGLAPAGTAAGGAGLVPAAVSVAVTTVAAPDRPDPTLPAGVRVALDPPPAVPAGLAASAAAGLPGVAAPAPAVLPTIPAPVEVLTWLRAALPLLDPEIGNTASAGAVLVPPVAVAVAPAAVSAPDLAPHRADPTLPVPMRSDGDVPLRALRPVAPGLPAIPLPPQLTRYAEGDAKAGRPAPLAAEGSRIAFVVLSGASAAAEVWPDWVRSVAGPTAAAAGGPGRESLSFAEGAWRGSNLALFPDRADPAAFLTARAAGERAWLVYDRLDGAGPDLDARLAAARERARRDGAVALLVAPDPALLARIGDWLAEPGAPRPVPVSALY
jgi:hypothetical protein